jgi:antitoxin YefM
MGNLAKPKVTLTALYKFLYGGNMPHVSYGELHRRLAFYMDRVCDDRLPVVVTLRSGRSVIMMAEDDYNGLLETVHLLASPVNAARLLRSIQESNVANE